MIKRQNLKYEKKILFKVRLIINSDTILNRGHCVLAREKPLFKSRCRRWNTPCGKNIVMNVLFVARGICQSIFYALALFRYCARTTKYFLDDEFYLDL